MSATTADMSVTSSPIPPITKSVRISSYIRGAGALLLIVLLFLEWVPNQKLGLEGSGGGGFGVLALVTALVTLVSVAQTMRGELKERPIFGINQLSFVLANALFQSNLVFLWVFTTGGAPKWVYISSNALIYAGIIGLFTTTPDKPEPVADSKAKMLGVATIVCGLGIAAAPMLEYTKISSSLSFTGYEPGAPRVGLLLLIYAAIIIFYGAHRVYHGASFSEGGRYSLWPHVTIAFGVAATACPLAWMISGLWGSDFDPGIGVYLGVVAGVALTAVGVYEAKLRHAPGI